MNNLINSFIMILLLAYIEIIRFWDVSEYSTYNSVKIVLSNIRQMLVQIMLVS